MIGEETYEQDLWKWFLARARTHNGYGWDDLSPKAASHLAECGIDYAKSDTPDVGTVSEFDGTDNTNQELDAITVWTWVCNCGAYGDRLGYRTARRELTLAIPGPYPMGQVIYEVIKESTGE